MIVLALDQAPRGAGFCYGDGSALPKWGYREFPSFEGNESALMDHVFDWLVTLGKSVGAEVAFTEQIVINARAINTAVLHKQFAVYDAIAFACGKRGLNIDHYEALIAEWRVSFLGIGGAPKHAGKSRTDYLKDLAMRECAARGWLPGTHHEAEAIGIWDYGLKKLDASYRHRSAFQTRRAQTRRDEERRSA